MSQDQKPQTDADLIKQVEMLKGQLKTREDQLRQAIDIANRANVEKEARNEAEKEDLINRLVIDSKYTREDLKDKPLEEVRIIKTAVDKSIDKTFASVAADMAEQDRKTAPLFTIGKWDYKKQDWVGGI